MVSKEVVILASTEALVKTLASRLREAGYFVFPASSLEEALMIVREVPIGIVLIESSVLARESDARRKILHLRPDCHVVSLDSFEQVKTSGNLLQFGRPDFILRGGELMRLIGAAGDVDGASGPNGADRTMAQSFTKILDVLVRLQEADDSFFAGFTNQVTRLAGAIADEMGLSAKAQEEIVIACLLRDIGKAGVKQEILEEQDKLSDIELEHMETHVLWSVRLLEHIDFTGKELPLIRHHHERYDGRGYPDGLKGRQIPLGSRIIATAEAFAAMTSNRPYRPANSQEKALEELMAGVGTQFDPEVVEALMNVLLKKPSSGLAARNQVILIVDPDKEFRRLLKMRLLNEGHRVVTTGNLNGEIRSPVSHAPDLVLFEASGEREAYQYLAKLRQEEGGQRVPFAVMIPNNEDRELRLRALSHGVDDLITKSGDLEEIAARVANILTREAARQRGPGMNRPAGVRGHLRNLPMSDILQMLYMGKKTASVTLTSPGGSGKIWFHDGSMIHAECDSMVGEEAFNALMQREDAEFLIQHGVAPTSRSIESDPMLLLMEYFR